MADHARLMPSAAHRWVECPGSVQAEERYPEPPSESAEEGTAAHWVASEVLTSYLPNSDGANVQLTSDYLDEVAPNGVTITDEIVEGVELYVRDVLKVTQRDGSLSALHVEDRVSIERVHPENWGTTDAVIWTPGRLIVWDFKFGRRPVECRKNWQLIEYAIGALDEATGSNGLADQEVIVELRVVQPRAFHVDGPCRNWICKGSDLRAYANTLSNQAGLALGDNPPCRAGEYCRDCTARRGCLTLQHATADIADRIECLQLHDLAPVDVAVELRYLRQAEVLVKARKEALEAQALQQSLDGTVIPGYGVGYGRGSTRWNHTDSEVIALGELMGVNLRKPEAPITPIQAKNLLDESVISTYSERVKGSAKLVETPDTITSRIFSRSEL